MDNGYLEDTNLKNTTEILSSKLESLEESKDNGNKTRQENNTLLKIQHNQEDKEKYSKEEINLTEKEDIKVPQEIFTTENDEKEQNNDNTTKQEESQNTKTNTMQNDIIENITANIAKKDETIENDYENFATESDTSDEIVELRKKDRKSKLVEILRQSFRKNKSNLRASFNMKRSISEPNNSESIKKRSMPRRTNSFRIFKATFFYLPILRTTQPPAPLLVEDPPSSDDANDLEKVKNSADPALNGSSGNFGSAGAKSAPPTPQGLLCTSTTTGSIGGCETLSQPNSPGCTSPSIQRSPSHTVFTKCDKSSLKHLSTSTPAMTAQAHLSEPPSPKAVKDPKVHTTSKARQKKFLRHFPNVEDDEKVLNHYSCALIGDILLQGHLYITKNYFAFYSNVFGYVTKLLIPILSVEDITKEKTARIIPNAVGIVTGDEKHVFGSLMSRDNTLQYMRTVWQKAKSEEIIPEPEITELEQDSSESAESGHDSPGPEMIAPPTFSLVRKLKADVKLSQNEGILLERKGSKGFVKTLKQAISEFRKLPRQSLILVATTLLLILLFLSAAVLLYRINKIQNRYSLALSDNIVMTGSEDIYSDLLQWQTQLHSKSAGAVHGFLDSNLDQIAKVRQSLEALSTLLINNNNDNQERSDVRKTEESLESTKEPVRSS